MVNTRVHVGGMKGRSTIRKGASLGSTGSNQRGQHAPMAKRKDGTSDSTRRIIGRATSRLPCVGVEGRWHGQEAAMATRIAKSDRAHSVLRTGRFCRTNTHAPDMAHLEGNLTKHSCSTQPCIAKVFETTRDASHPYIARCMQKHAIHAHMS